MSQGYRGIWSGVVCHKAIEGYGVVCHKAIEGYGVVCQGYRGV